MSTIYGLQRFLFAGNSKIKSLELALVAAFFMLCASSQSGAQDIQKTFAKLPAPAQDVVKRLMSLGELPDGAWKMHSGNVAHGEAVGLDESDWQPIALQTKTTKDAEWFRQKVTIPATLHGYDLTGAKIWFQFHANANGPMPEILYFNGRRVALGDDLEPIVLVDQAKPGESVQVAVKLLHTVEEKGFNGATMRIEFPDRQAQSRRPGLRVRQCCLPDSEPCAG